MKEYICECGKIFDNPQRFNGHKKNCLIHLKSCGKEDKIDEYVLSQKIGAAKNGELRRKQNAEIKQNLLNQWISEQHTCERCGKVMTEKFGSGRFCSRHCANSKPHSEEAKNNIRNGILNKTPSNCPFCGEMLKSKSLCAIHMRFCSLNPNKERPKGKKGDPNRPYKIDRDTTLNVSFGFIDNYLKTQLTCEICGKTVEQVSKPDRFGRVVKRLCIDHDHKTNSFRGVLCVLCNRQLGWYENNMDAINKYINKEHPKDPNCLN